MCVLCQNFQPWSDACLYAPPKESVSADAATDTGDGSGAEPPTYTNDQIADQLTDGYWGGSSRSFDVISGDTLYVDVTGLTSNGQDMARAALDAWSVVTGISFVEVAGTAPPDAILNETSDAADTISTSYTMTVGDDFLGTLDEGGDRDGGACCLTQVQTVQSTHAGEGNRVARGDARSEVLRWIDQLHAEIEVCRLAA